MWAGRSRTLAVAAVIGMVTSVVFFAVVPVDIGLKQRLWLLANTALLGGALVVPLRPGTDSGAEPSVQARVLSSSVHPSP